MTPYTTVYSRFLGKIRDYPLLEEMERDQDFVKRILHDYLLGAIANFTYATPERLGRDDELEQFNGSLNTIEIEILAKLMVVEYLSPIVISSDKIEFNLPSKDFNTYSPANLIKQVAEIQDRERSQAIDMMVENYYRSGFR